MKKFDFSFLGGLLVALALTACGGGESTVVEPELAKPASAASVVQSGTVVGLCGAGNNCPGEIYPTGPGAVQNIGAIVSTPAGPVCTIKQPGNEPCSGKGKKICTACPAMNGVPAYTLCNWEPAPPPPTEACPDYYNQRER